MGSGDREPVAAGDVHTEPSATDSPGTVAWHDVECGSYDADLPLWRELAERARGPLLEVGAGTGRVALDLALRGHAVTAIDADAQLLAALEQRAVELGLEVPTATADARRLDLPQARFALCIVPMQTVQLLGGASGRAQFLARARAHLRHGGILAAAIADAREGYDPSAPLPLPDTGECKGWQLVSQPVAVLVERDAVGIQRIRTATGPGGAVHEDIDLVRLDRIGAEDLEREGTAAGFTVLPAERVPPTEIYVGSEVVMLEA